MAVDDLFKIATEFAVECGCGAVFSCQTQRFREQPHVGFCGTHHRDGLGVFFDHDFCAFPHASKE